MAVFIPHIRNYAPFYIQRESDASAVDIRSTYGITIKAHDYPSGRQVKQPYKNDWLDRDGDDEYADVLRYEAFTLKLDCVLMSDTGDSDTAREELRELVVTFRDALRHGVFRIYDAWTTFGFKNVRLDAFPAVSDGAFSVKDGRCRLIFGIEFKVNDPVSPVKLENGSIVDDEGGQAPYLEIRPTTITLVAAGTAQSVSVTSNISWSIS